MLVFTSAGLTTLAGALPTPLLKIFITCSCFAIGLRIFGPLSIFQFLPSPLSNLFGTPPSLDQVFLTRSSALLSLLLFFGTFGNAAMHWSSETSMRPAMSPFAAAPPTFICGVTGCRTPKPKSASRTGALFYVIDSLSFFLWFPFLDQLRLIFGCSFLLS